MYFKGFTGLATIDRASDPDLSFRFGNSALTVNQDQTNYHPVYGGKELRRIFRPNVGEIGGRIGGPLTEGIVDTLYEITNEAETFDLILMYYRTSGSVSTSSARKYTDCVVDSFTLECRAGEIVQFSLDIKALDHQVGTYFLPSSAEKTSKLVTWDKCTITGAYPLSSGYYMGSFNYVINNNLVTIRTANGIRPYAINRAVQDVHGNIVLYGKNRPYFETGASERYSLAMRELTFEIEDLTVEHKAAFHWSEDNPLTPEVITSTIQWTRADDFPGD